jgi:hypothetical protein
MAAVPQLLLYSTGKEVFDAPLGPTVPCESHVVIWTEHRYLL